MVWSSKYRLFATIRRIGLKSAFSVTSANLVFKALIRLPVHFGKNLRLLSAPYGGENTVLLKYWNDLINGGNPLFQSGSFYILSRGNIIY